MQGVLDMITKLTLPTLLVNKLISRRSSQGKKQTLSLNFKVVFLKTIKHALSMLLYAATQL